MITSRQLEYFHAVARELHFTRAAARLHIAQPALSQHIRKLEAQLGLELFDRDRHRVELTSAGVALLAHAERILADIGAVEDELRDWAGSVRGRVRLGTARGVATRLVKALAGFSAAYPEVDVELHEETTIEMLADLRDGRLDVATLAAVPPPGEPVATHPLGTEPLVLVTGASGPFAGRERVPISALDGIDLAVYGPGSAIGATVATALAAAGVTARARFQTREFSTARLLAADGLSVAILPESVANEPGHPVRIVRLDPEPTWTPVLAWSARRRPAPAVRTFTGYVIDALATGSAPERRSRPA